MAKSVTGNAFDIPLFKRIMTYVRPYNKVFYITAGLSVLLAFLAWVRPVLIQVTIDENIKNLDKEGLLVMTLILIGVLLIESILEYFFNYMSNLLGQNVIRDLRNQVFKHVINFKLKHFDKTPIGQLVTRTVSDIETIAEMFSGGILVIISDLLKIFTIITYMFIKQWDLALITLIPIPILFFATSIFKRVIKKAFQEVREQVSVLNTFVQEHITGMSIVQIFNREEVEMEKFSDINKKHRAAHIKTVWAYSIFFPIVEMLSAASVALLVWYGFKEVAEQHATPGVIFSFILFIYMLYRPIRQLADRFNTLQMGMVSSERVFKVLDTKSTIENNGTLKPTNLTGNIKFKNVWFAYNDEDWVLKNITIDMKKGESLALVGATGAGKSSIINLLGRYYEINKGEITIDGINIKNFDLNHLRKTMSIVLQDVFLFSDSILNNITLYSEDITKEQVIEAAKKIGAHEFIAALPNGYDYNVKERGALLSVGQRQLISFIRAYVHQPEILILDEATSSIDSESEALIQRATDIITKDRTSIIVAHRLSTVKNANKIMVLDKGEIMEEGSHFELLKKDGYYKKLYDYQFKNQVEDEQ
ncbi:MAG: ABC transporter ATP-binding protein [Flavobacteriales bacterium]|nr:ABC transporter ATP-binding protein [Flavobacteriales bacterium]MCB9364122.1 ABC transporter ATP-binding protein [Flavobacteriales bacterium]